jgi:hypothetical protein
MSRLFSVKSRLTDLNIALIQEEASSDRSQNYIDDLKLTISQCEAEIAQLEFAKANPDPLLVNGAVVA